jgi:hypothetical protein
MPRACPLQACFCSSGFWSCDANPVPFSIYDWAVPANLQPEPITAGDLAQPSRGVLQAGQARQRPRGSPRATRPRAPGGSQPHRGDPRRSGRGHMKRHLPPAWTPAAASTCCHGIRGQPPSAARMPHCIAALRMTSGPCPPFTSRSSPRSSPPREPESRKGRQDG